MNSRRPTGASRNVSRETISRRRLLAAGGAVAAGSLAGCLNRAASVVTNTGASPAAVFAGTQKDSVGEFVVSEPHVARLTPMVSGRVELEGWATSSAMMAQDYNSSRSNKPRSRAVDEDSDGDGIQDLTEEEADELLVYLGGKPIVAERFTVCLPDAEVPGGNGSIREEVTPERLIAYLTGDNSVAGLSKADSKKSRAVEGGGDCDDSDDGGFPGAVCGTTPHFVAEVSEPTATGSGLEVVRAEDGTVFVLSGSAGSSEDERVCESGGEGRVGMLTMRECGLAGWPEPTESGSSTSALVYQVMVQPPRCPHPFPALLYVQRCESDDQLVYTGGWVIDDDALYEDSLTVLSMVGATEVVGTKLSDLGDSFEDVAGGSDSPPYMVARRRRGARLDSGRGDELVESGVLSSESHDIIDVIVSRGGDFNRNVDEDVSSDEYGFVTHVAVDAPVLHLAAAGGASESAKFKAGAELSKAAN